ncbi:hypothetical protein BJ322DRAFT_367307 [Thelephora terrestris]|uniref:RGS domain-containing protein n=1 Tax=Thelephora terrestris TaxID=56493 RepID=A0A9P6H500_9AGAM|nr:hypothetical protein BJ322DRAFT_367307 [Thelephora terrestris]
MGDRQPRTFKLSPSALLALPRRLCNPPPSVGKVRSFSATAVVDVTLDDVLDRKHLPPLGLKDFEEWLLFVEQNAENLYFILWLKEYNARYTQWIKNARALLKSDSTHPYQSTSMLPPSFKTNRSLAIFYSRAKQTFFTPNSPYELDLPSDILGPFHTPSLSDSDSLNHSNRDCSASSGALSPHPDPAVFSHVEDQVRSMLQESLSRFANSTISNVGTSRATCGLIGGTLIALVGFVPPVAENFAFSKNRWLRILAFPGLWLGLTIILASLRGICMMIYVFGDLRQLRSFELVRPSISPPRRLRPLRNNTTLFRAPPEPEPWLIPITRPPIIPKPIHDPEKQYSPLASTGPIRFLTPIPEPISPSVSPSAGRRSDTFNRRVTVTSFCSGSFTSCDSGGSRTSTTSSDEVEIHISEAFYDIEPPYPSEDLMTSSPAPSSWQGESPMSTPLASTSYGRSYLTDSVLPPGPAGNIFRASETRTSAASGIEGEILIPTAGFIRPFEYNEWEEWDGQSLMCTTEGSLGGYGAGDEESRISHFTRHTSLSQDRQRAVGTRLSAHSRTRPRRGTIASSRVSEESGIFDFDALPAFQTTASAAMVPTPQRRPRYRTCDASPPPPLHDETRLTEERRREGFLRTWSVEFPMLFIRRTQGKCAATKQVIKDVLSRSAREASVRNAAENGSQAAYRDTLLETGDWNFSIAVETRAFNNPARATAPLPLSHPLHTVSNGKHDGKPVKENWRIRWQRVLSVPAFKSPLTKILSPIVTRAHWEVVVRSGAFAFIISLLVVTVLVAVPVP